MSERQIRTTIASCCEELDRQAGAERRRSRKLARLLLPVVASLTLGAADGGQRPAPAPPDGSTVDAARVGGDQVDGGAIDAGEAIAMYSAPGCGC